jgi:DMSO/TMAO reductase YedYZ molybdopterin-dependent catalytic subunit
MSQFSRRKLLVTGVGVSAGLTGLAATTDGLIPADARSLYGAGATLTYAAQQLLGSHSMAREFPRSAISKVPYPNGKVPKDEIFTIQQANGFADWKLSIQGMVQRPLSFSLAELKAMPAKSQITQLTCEEGWSYVAEWTGVPLSVVLSEAGLDPAAKFVVYESLQIKGARYDSVDLEEALHPQTLVTYGLNGQDLPVANGGPLRMRVPRQLGYKSIKFMTHITVTDSLAGFGKGKGSSAADAGYSWFAGI